jgi:hypothetical protein
MRPTSTIGYEESNFKESVDLLHKIICFTRGYKLQI